MARQGRQSHENARTDEVAKHERTAPARAVSPIDAVLRMQGSAGNRATGAALARRRRPRRTPPHGTAAATSRPRRRRLTVDGIGSFDDVASFQVTGRKSLRFDWDPAKHNAALQDAVISGRRIPKVTIETPGMTITLHDALATQFQTAGAGDAPLVSVEFEGDTIHYGDASAEPLPAPDVTL